ncbi:hypothetical protein L207DRAFT_510544 [Hyaloscypha variabilis F]|uniref:Uncharacterized protein n=1 Tax=Hyaloscypha variabilis (strain UAMH 11265 / GT02V1 / F) TaxID=1149755 RepID=A0A2J6RUX8_HYAVF|nr:hypothetical protein L207DRAFT_510544 [Hyaloscypha variabilis F]
MSQNSYSNSGLRATQIPFDCANLRSVSSMPMQEVPMRAQYAFEPQMGGPRIPHAFEQESRGLAYSEHQRPGSITADGNTRGHDPPRADHVQQPRPQRMMPVDSGIRYVQPEVLEAPGQAWSHLSFAESDLVDQFTHVQSSHMIPEQPSVEGSPRSTLGKSKARRSDSNSEDNLSTATTAVDHTRSSEQEMLREILVQLAEIKQAQTLHTKKLEAMEKRVDAMDTATATRLSDFREHVDKKIERLSAVTETGFDDIWDRTVLELKRVRDLILGHDPRRTPPTDDSNHDFGMKRRRFED